MMFGFPKASRKKLGYNLLNCAIFQIKFDGQQELLHKKETLPPELSKIYTNCNDINQAQSGFSVSPDGTPVASTSAFTKIGLTFTNKNGTRRLDVTQDSATLQILAGAYTGFEDALKEFVEHHMPKLKNCGVSKLKRLAIRKINLLNVQIEGSKQELRNIISAVYNKELTSHIQAMPKNTSIIDNLSVIKCNNKEDYNLNIQYGCKNLHPKNNTYQFIYDMDIFKISDNTIMSDLEKEFTKINSEIYNIFVWGMNDKFLNTSRVV